MSYETYHSIFVIAAFFSVFMALVSLFIFIMFRIPTVISKLTGAAAKKGINEIRKRSLEETKTDEPIISISSNSTEKLLESASANDTTVLVENNMETTLLNSELEVSIILIHTDEIVV